MFYGIRKHIEISSQTDDKHNSNSNDGFMAEKLYIFK
jgi:hypothetical protein